MNHFLAFIFMNLISLPLFAQYNFQEGSITPLTGESENGWIDIDDINKSPSLIYFKENKDDAVHQTHSPASLNGFTLEEGQYISAITEIENSSNIKKEQDFAPKPKTEIDTVFLKVLIEGPKSLYFRINSSLKENFYIKQEGEYVLLRYKEYKIDYLGNIFHKKNNSYIDQLNHYLSDYPYIKENTKRLKYKEKSLRKLFVEHRYCTDPDAARPKPIGITAYAMGGVSSMWTGWDVPDFFPITSFKINRPHIGAGLSYDISLRKKKDFLFTNEFALMSTRFNYNNLIDNNWGEDKYHHTSVNLNFLHARINSMIRYKYQGRKISIFANTGILLSRLLHIQNSMKTERNGGLYYQNWETPAMHVVKKGNQGLIIGAGISKGPIVFEYRFEKSRGISGNWEVNPLTRNHIILGYTF